MKYLLLAPLVLTGLFAKDLTPKELYKQECATCHMAYQPEFLPKRSWDKMMNNLSNHFDSDASLNNETMTKIKTYLDENASDAKRVRGEIGEFAHSISDNSTPLRITEIPKFKREHREISTKMIEQKEVKSLSNCTACHTDADKGTFRERNINIPNYGKYEEEGEDD